MARVGLQEILRGVQVEVADCCVRVVLRSLTVHLEGTDLGVVGC
jgi:hypothetical protein